MFIGPYKQSASPMVKPKLQGMGAATGVASRERLKAALRQLLIQPDLLMESKKQEQQQLMIELSAEETEENTDIDINKVDYDMRCQCEPVRDLGFCKPSRTFQCRC